MDAGYGVNSDFRARISKLGLQYVAGVLPTTTVWPPGLEPLPAKPWTPGHGRPAKRLRRDDEHQPVSVKPLALGLPNKAWRTISWRQGTNAKLRSRFARLRVRPAHLDYQRSEPWPEQWLLIEWPRGEKEPTKYWLSTLPATIGFAAMVRMTKLRWRIECGGGGGERQAIPPSGPRRAAQRQAPCVSRGSRSGPSAAANRTSRAQLDRHDAAKAERRRRSSPAKMPLLRSAVQTGAHGVQFMTQ